MRRTFVITPTEAEFPFAFSAFDIAALSKCEPHGKMLCTQPCCASKTLFQSTKQYHCSPQKGES
jgi:hypothetical protein